MPQFVGDIDGHVAGPSFGGVECNDPDRIFILPFEQVADQRRAADCDGKSRVTPASTCELYRCTII
jgi:hypothetical protein